MLLPHNEATATITIDGLAICCFNRGDKKWDLAFLHHPHPPAHRLILLVDGHRENLPQQPGLLTFETVNGHFPTGFPDGFFDNGPIRNRRVPPATPEEEENFRWVMDLEDPHDVNHGNVTLKKPDPSFPITRAYIQNAVFYTSRRSPDDLILLPDGQDPNQTPNPTIYGKTNDEMSGDIFCDAGGQVVIKVDGNEIRRLDHRPGKPWTICLTHMCPLLPVRPGTRFEKGDFHLFYDVLNITGNRHALWGKPNTPSAMSCAEANHSGRTDCDTVRLGNTNNLDALFT